MQNKQVIIIGGGYAGLSLGCYLQMNDFDTTILEKDALCGGISVSWERKGYTFDGATHYMCGSSRNSNLHYILNEIIDFSKLDMYNFSEFICVEHNEKQFHVYTDADRLKEEMYRIAPEDGSPIDCFIAAIKQFGTFQVPFEKAPEVYTFGDRINFLKKQLPLVFFRQKWAKITIEEFAKKFKNPDMRVMFQKIFPEHEYFSIMALIAPLAWMNAKNAGYPMGGSKSVIGLCIERYQALGGTIENEKEVDTIHVENNRATKVTCIDGSSYPSDIVFSAADLHTTLFKLLDAKYIDGKTYKRFHKLKPFTAIVQVSLGIKRPFTEKSEKFYTALTEELTFGKHTSRDMLVRICSFDPSFAPKGCTAVVAQLRNEESAYWQALRQDDKRKYNRQKERIAQIVIDSLEKRFGNIKDHVEVVDVATPATFTRYTNLWKGAQQGWAPTPQAVGRLQKKTLPKVKNFYLTGQWLSAGGGIPAVFSLSRQGAQLVCKADNKTFKSHPA